MLCAKMADKLVNVCSQTRISPPSKCLLWNIGASFFWALKVEFDSGSGQFFVLLAFLQIPFGRWTVGIGA